MARAKHKSIPKELKKICNWLENQGAKLVIGLSECARHKYAPGTIKISRETEAGFKCIAYSGNGIMNIFIVAKEDALKETIRLKLDK